MFEAETEAKILAHFSVITPSMAEFVVLWRFIGIVV